MPSQRTKRRFRSRLIILITSNISVNSISAKETVKRLLKHGTRWLMPIKRSLKIMTGWRSCLMQRISVPKPSLRVARRLNWHPMPTAIVKRWRNGLWRMKTMRMPWRNTQQLRNSHPTHFSQNRWEINSSKSIDDKGHSCRKLRGWKRNLKHRSAPQMMPLVCTSDSLRCTSNLETSLMPLKSC